MKFTLGCFYMNDFKTCRYWHFHGINVFHAYTNGLSLLKTQVCVLVSHVVPFGDVKIHQQNALLSLSGENLKRKPPVPTIIVGDLNRFWDDREVFDKQLQKYKVCEAKPKKLIIRHRHNEKNIQEEFEGRDVGTFSPWPTDSAVYERLLKEPISKSPLDVQLLTDDTSLIEEETTETYAAMMREPNKHTPPRGRDPVRHKLDKRMASDHLAILGKYQVKRHPENQPELPLYKQAITWFQPCVLLWFVHERRKHFVSTVWIADVPKVEVLVAKRAVGKFCTRSTYSAGFSLGSLTKHLRDKH